MGYTSVFNKSLTTIGPASQIRISFVHNTLAAWIKAKKAMGIPGDGEAEDNE